MNSSARAASIPLRTIVWATISIIGVSTTDLATGDLAAQEIAAIEGQLTLRKVDPILGQSTVSGTISLASSPEHTITALARSNGGILYGISTAQPGPSVVTNDASRIYSIDPDTGSAVPIATVGSLIAVAATIHPSDGSVWALHAGGPLTPFGAHLILVRIDPSNGQSTTLGELPHTSGPFSGLEFDANGALYTVQIKNSTLWRVDSANPGGGITAGIGGLGFQVSNSGVELARRDDGSILAYHSGDGAFYTVDTTSGLASQIGSLPTPVLGPITAGGCGGEGVPYGAGCPGSGGFVPQLSLAGCADPGSPVTLLLSQALGGSTALVFLAAGQASTPLGAGCSLLVAPPFPSPVALPLAGAGFGNGSLTIPAFVPPGLSGVTVHLQAFSLDAAVSIGAAASNGLQIAVP